MVRWEIFIPLSTVWEDVDGDRREDTRRPRPVSHESIGVAPSVPCCVVRWSGQASVGQALPPIWLPFKVGSAAGYALFGIDHLPVRNEARIDWPVRSATGVVDAFANRPQHHLASRIGYQKRFQPLHISGFLAEPYRPIGLWEDHRHPIVQRSDKLVRWERDDRRAPNGLVFRRLSRNDGVRSIGL
jgi:hypothetical protein